MRTSPVAWLGRAAQAALRALWFFVIPLLLAANALRYLVPGSVEAAHGLLVVPAQLGRAYPLPFAMALFVAFVLLLRYWRFFLPGGRYLAQLPLTMAAQIPRDQLSEFESAYELNAWLERPRVRRRVERKLSDALKADLTTQAGELAEALRNRDLGRLQRSKAALSPLTARGLKWRSALETGGFGVLLAGAIFLAFGLRAKALQNYEVLSSSMLPSFERGDQVTTNRTAYRPATGAGTLPPRRGDVVIFRRDQIGGGQELTKRVLGLPGDRISMQAGYPIINGWPVPSCDVGRYVYWRAEIEIDGRVRLEFLEDKSYLTLHTPEGKLFGNYQVKPGEVFVVGDNRNESSDSRNWDNGKPLGLPVNAIDGAVERLFFSRLRSGDLDLRSLFKRPGMDLNLDGLDVSGMQAKIAECLKSRPANTTPPPSSAGPQASRAGSKP